MRLHAKTESSGWESITTAATRIGLHTDTLLAANENSLP